MTLLRFALPLVFLIVSFGARANQQDLVDWYATVDELVAFVESTHPDPYRLTGRLTFHRAADQLREDLPDLAEEERVVRAMQLVALLGEGHTQLEPYENSSFTRWYPIRIYEFDDGIFVTSAHRSVRELVGAELVSVGGLPAVEAVERARSLMGADNHWDHKERLYAFHNSGLMSGLGIANQDGTLDLVVRSSGELREVTLHPVDTGSSTFDWSYQPEYWGAFDEPADWVTPFDGASVADLRELDRSRALHVRYRRARYAEYVRSSDLYYVQLNVVGYEVDGETMAGFFRRIMGEVDQHRPRHLVLDLRYNFGGDGSQIQPLLRELIRRSPDPPWDELYVITGRRTFSAAVLMLANLIEHLGPTLLGEPAGAPLNSFGDSNATVLPSALRLYVSHERHQKGRSTDTASFVPVHVPASFTFADYSAGRDPAIDLITSGREARSVARVAATDGAERALEVYLERKQRGAASWRPPSEIALRGVARSLIESGDLDTALELTRLGTLINPDEWRTWYNHGNLLMKIGREAEAIESYRQSLALEDPTNFNTPRLERIVREYNSRTGTR